MDFWNINTDMEYLDIIFTISCSKWITKKLKIISCSNNFTHVKVKNILHPSELNSIWLKKKKLENKYQTDFLVCGKI